MNLDDLRCDVQIARHLIRRGEQPAAARLLLAHLRHCDLPAATRHPVLAEAAGLYLSIATDPSWPPRLHPPHPPATPAGPVPPIPGREHTVELPVADTTAAAQATRPGGGLVINHRAFSVDLAHAQRLHGHGRCGEAIRHADQALRAWQAAHPAKVHGRGVTLIAGLAAMLSACLRDTAARTVIAANSTYLPAPGTADRSTFAVHTLAVMDTTIRPHPQVCLAHAPSAANTALDATGDDRLPWWPYRRDRWWQLLIRGPEQPS